MERLEKKIEVAANIAIILVTIMIGGVLLHKYFFSPKGTALPTIPVGTKLSLADVDWAKNGQTLLLALQTGCHFCSESSPFYQRLASEASNSKIPLVAVFPQPIDEGRDYLNKLKVPITDVKQISLKSIGVQGTPAILLVNSGGEVTAGWLGKLPPVKESEVISKLRR